MYQYNVPNIPTLLTTTFVCFVSSEFKWLWLVAGNRYHQCDGIQRERIKRLKRGWKNKYWMKEQKFKKGQHIGHRGGCRKRGGAVTPHKTMSSSWCKMYLLLHFHGVLATSLHLPVLHYYICKVLFYLPHNQLWAIIKGTASFIPR